MIFGQSEVNARMASYRYWTRPAEVARQRVVADSATHGRVEGDPALPTRWALWTSITLLLRMLQRERQLSGRARHERHRD